jgi:5-methylcytosine-specific restriction endonuclease McrA
MTDQGRLVQRLKKARRRAGLKGVLTAAEWVRLIAAWGSRCAYCRAAGVKLTIDHVVPLARGGWNVVQNVVPACRYCNCSLKKDRPVDVVLARLGLDRFRWQARRQFAVRAALA